MTRLRISIVTQNAVDIVINKQVKDTILAKRIIIHFELTKFSKIHDSCVMSCVPIFFIKRLF